MEEPPTQEAVDHFKKVCDEHPGLKRYFDQNGITLTMLTCSRCAGCSGCDFAFDPYNTDGDCLAEK